MLLRVGLRFIGMDRISNPPDIRPPVNEFDLWKDTRYPVPNIATNLLNTTCKSVKVKYVLLSIGE